MTEAKNISVLVVDDSAFMRAAISRMVESSPDLRVAGTAFDGVEALSAIERLNPDVVTLDIEMPRMNGLETLRHIMTECPRPVIMLSSLTTEGAESTLDALDAGAFDCIPKPSSQLSLDIVSVREELISKIRAAAKCRPLHRKVEKRVSPPVVRDYCPCPQLICIGTSTGGPKALQQIIPMLPAELPVPIAIVQHMPIGFTAPFANRLNAISSITVSEATDGECARPGHVYIAPAGQHLSPELRGGEVVFSVGSSLLQTAHVPSVDVMMLSAARNMGRRTMGIILTGMGNDGEQGMREIFSDGGYTVGQDEASCVVYGMPRACAEAGVLRQVLPLDAIPDEICFAARYSRGAVASQYEAAVSDRGSRLSSTSRTVADKSSSVNGFCRKAEHSRSMSSRNTRFSV